MRAFIRQHPTASYFVLAFAISWGGILAVLRGGPIPAPTEEAQRLFVFVYLAMLAGPSAAGIAITVITGGRPALSDFGRRLLRWRVAARWYAVALLTAPLTLLVALQVLSLLSIEFVPAFQSASGGPQGLPTDSRMPFLVMGLLIGIGAGFFEELGWTGAALPKLRERHGWIGAGVLLGAAWGAWHFLAIYWGSSDAFGSVPVALYMAVALFSFLPPFRVLMAWVYDRTGSLLIAVLMHASLTTSMLIFGPALVGGALLTFDLVFSAALWLVVGIVAMAVGAEGIRRRQALIS